MNQTMTFLKALLAFILTLLTALLTPTIEPVQNTIHRDAEWHETNLETREDTYYVYDTFTIQQ